MADEGLGKVLIVDDEPSIRSSLKQLLRQEGYTPVTASDGGEAIKKLEKEGFDAVLLDLIMEPVGGMDVLKAVHEKYPSCAVIIMTGFATIESAISTLKLGAYDYLLKPFKPDEMLNILRKAMEWRRLELELRERERQLRESRRKYQTLFEETSDAVVVFDKIGKILDANAFAEMLFGYSKHELLEMSFFDLYAKSPRAEQVSPSVVQDYSAYFEIELRRKDGSPIVGEMSARRIELDGEQVFQAVIRDITNRKRLIEESLRAKDEAEELLHSLCTRLLMLTEDTLPRAKGRMAEQLSAQRELLERVLLVLEPSTGSVELDDAVRAAVDALPDVRVSYEPSGLTVRAGEQLAHALRWVLEDARDRGAEHIQMMAERLGESVQLCISDDALCHPEEVESLSGLMLASRLISRWGGRLSVQQKYEGEPEAGCRTCIVLEALDH